MSKIGLIPASPQNSAATKNVWMPFTLFGKMAASDSTSKLVTIEQLPEKVASKELTRFQRLKQKVSAIRASVVAQAEAHPQIAAGLVGCVVAAAVWGVRLHMPRLGDLIAGKAPVKGDLNDSAPATDRTNANAVLPSPSNTENVGKPKAGNEPVFTSLMQKLMPTKMNWTVAGKVGVVVVTALVAKRVFDVAILEWWGIGPSATASVHRALEVERNAHAATNVVPFFSDTSVRSFQQLDSSVKMTSGPAPRENYFNNTPAVENARNINRHSEELVANRAFPNDGVTRPLPSVENGVAAAKPKTAYVRPLMYRRRR